MIAPKSLIYQLYRYWEVVESLTLLSREYPAFELSMLEQVINQNKSKEVDTNSVLSSLVNADILLLINRTDNYQLNSLVIDFVRGLTQEHELGLSAVLKARIDAIKKATNQVIQGLDESDSDMLRTGAHQLSELIRKISQQLKQDKQAIFEIAESAKSTSINTPIERRYREVLEAYDQYVEPMNEMMDTSLGGNFYPLLERAEEALDHAVDTLSIRGSLYQQRLSMRQIGYQVKDLRYQGRIIAKQCADILLPLREEARQHNHLSAVISKQLSFVRKKGLARGLGVSGLPIWKSDRTNKIQLGNEVRELMNEWMNFEPKSMPFPDDMLLPQSADFNWIDEDSLRKQLVDELPIENLMIWLKNNYPSLLDEQLLRLYHELVRDKQWRSVLNSVENTTELKTISVTYYSHCISNFTHSATSKSLDNAK